MKLAEKLPVGRFTIWAIITIIVWVGVPIFSKLGSDHFNGLEMAFWVNLFAMPVVTLWILPGQHRAKLKTYSLKTILILICIGFFGNLIYEVVYFISYQTISALTGIILSQSGGIIFILASMLFLKEKHSRMNLIAFVLTAVGAILSIVEPGSEFKISVNSGFWLMILANLLNTVYCFGNNAIKKKFADAQVNLFLYKLGTLVVLGIWALLTGTELISVDPSYKIGLNPPASDLLFPFMIGAFGDGIGFLAWLKLIEYGDSVKATIVNAIAVVTQVVLATIIYHETATVFNTVLVPLLVIIPTTLAIYLDSKSVKNEA